MSASGLAPLAFSIPMIGAALVAAIGSWVNRRVVQWLSFACALTCAALCAVVTAAATHGEVVHWFGGWTPVRGVAIGIDFVVDPVAGTLATFTAILTAAAVLFAWTYYEEGGPPFYTLMLVFLAAMAGFCLTGDLFNLFVFFELMSVAAYALTAYRCEDDSAIQGALSFAIVNSTGAFFTLFGIALLYGKTGALNMAQLHAALGTAPDRWVVAGAALILTGFLVKASTVPFHFWLSEAHAVAPTPLCVLFSGIMVELGLYGVARVYFGVFSGALGAEESVLRSILLGFGVTSALLGGAMAVTQRHFKRLLAFSTIGHSGIMLCGFALLRAGALGGLWMYVIGHGFLKAGLFMCSGILLLRFKSVDLDVLRNCLRGRWWLAAAIAFGALGLCGLPPFGTYLGKSMLDEASDGVGLSWLPYVMLVASALTGAAVLTATGTMTFGWGPRRKASQQAPKEEEESDEPPSGIPPVMFGTAVLMLAAALACGIWPLVPWPVHGSPRSAWLGVAAAALAIAFSAGALSGLRLELGLAQRLHSGKMTDYVAWLAAGSAVLALAFTALAR